MIPVVRILMDGTDITSNLIPAPFGLPLEAGGVSLPSGSLAGGPLLSIETTDNEGDKSDSCELEIDNREYHPAPKKGAKVQVYMGWAGGPLNYMGSYKVDTWTKRGSPRTLVVSCKAADLTSGIKAPKSRSYHGKKVKDIVDQVAGKNGLSSKVHPDLASIDIQHIDQSNESDLNFLSRLARRVGGKFKLGDGNIILNKAGSGQLPSGGDAPTFFIQCTGLVDWDASGAQRGEYGSVSAAYQDVDKGDRKWITAGDGTPKYRDRKLYKTLVEAQTSAKAQKDALDRGKVSLNIDMPADFSIFSGVKANCTGFDQDVDGLFNLKTVKNKVDNSGAKTSITAESVDGSKDGFGT